MPQTIFLIWGLILLHMWYKESIPERNHILNICRLNLIIYIQVLCQGENKNTLILEIDDRNVRYVFTSMDTQAAYLNLSLQYHTGV